jgi:hypothetical protein
VVTATIQAEFIPLKLEDVHGVAFVDSWADADPGAFEVLDKNGPLRGAATRVYKEIGLFRRKKKLDTAGSTNGGSLRKES